MCRSVDPPLLTDLRPPDAFMVFLASVKSAPGRLGQRPLRGALYMRYPLD